MTDEQLQRKLDEILRSVSDRRTIADLANAITADLVDKGLAVAGGWAAYRLLVLPRNASPIQVHECRLAFYSGAQHVFATMVNMLDHSGDEPTARDLRRMDSLD